MAISEEERLREEDPYTGELDADRREPGSFVINRDLISTLTVRGKKRSTSNRKTPGD